MNINLKMEGVIKNMRDDEEMRRLYAIHYAQSEEAKFLMRQAGFGVTGTNILETTKEALEEIKSLRLLNNIEHDG